MATQGFEDGRRRTGEAGQRDTHPRPEGECDISPPPSPRSECDVRPPPGDQRDVRPPPEDQRDVPPPPGDQRDVPPPPGDQRDVRPPPALQVAELASAQRGSVSRAQLLAAGMSRHSVERRARAGELHRQHRGVYIVGHLARAPMADEWAAVLACGDRAVISHRSAAYLWSIVAEAPQQVDVTLVGRRCRPKEGVRTHCTAHIDQRDIRRKDGLRLTSPARTLVDVAATADEIEARRALAEARVLRLLNPGELEDALERAGSRRGAGVLRALLLGERERGLTRSEAERRMLELVHAAALPEPLVNRDLAGYTVDFLWPESKLVVEVDGYRYHGHRGAFERDRRKDMALLAAGYRVMRVTWRQLLEQPLLVAAMLASALTGGRGHG